MGYPVLNLGLEYVCVFMSVRPSQEEFFNTQQITCLNWCRMTQYFVPQFSCLCLIIIYFWKIKAHFHWFTSLLLFFKTCKQQKQTKANKISWMHFYFWALTPLHNAYNRIGQVISQYLMSAGTNKHTQTWGKSVLFVGPEVKLFKQASVDDPVLIIYWFLLVGAPRCPSWHQSQQATRCPSHTLWAERVNERRNVCFNAQWKMPLTC